MKHIFIIIISLFTISCSDKVVPIGLRSTIKEIDKNLNDTVKYDFKITPERIATTKHHFGLGRGLRNEKGLWSGSLLQTYFKLNGIKHADDMSSIILETYHRKLNDKPIRFREQKKYYKEYWKVAQLEGEAFKKWWDTNNSKTELDSLKQIYFSNFSKDRKILGSLHAWTPIENGHSEGTDVDIIGNIIEKDDYTLKIKIVKLGSYEDKYELLYKIEDTIEMHIYDVFLIPPQNEN